MDEPAKELSDHAAYEVEAMCVAARRYAEGWNAANGATPAGLPDEVFFLEACLLHARNLYEFLFTEGGRLEPRHVGVHRYDVRAALARFEELQPAGSRIYGQLSTFVVHLTMGRWNATGDVQIHEPVELAGAILTVFEEQVAAVGSNQRLGLGVERGREELEVARQQ